MNPMIRVDDDMLVCGSEPSLEGVAAAGRVSPEPDLRPRPMKIARPGAHNSSLELDPVCLDHNSSLELDPVGLDHNPSLELDPVGLDHNSSLELDPVCPEQRRSRVVSLHRDLNVISSVSCHGDMGEQSGKGLSEGCLTLTERRLLDCPDIIVDLSEAAAAANHASGIRPPSALGRMLEASQFMNVDNCAEKTSSGDILAKQPTVRSRQNTTPLYREPGVGHIRTRHLYIQPQLLPETIGTRNLRISQLDRARHRVLLAAFDALRRLDMPLNPFTKLKFGSKAYLLRTASAYIRALQRMIAEHDRATMYRLGTPRALPQPGASSEASLTRGDGVIHLHQLPRLLSSLNDVSEVDDSLTAIEVRRASPICNKGSGHLSATHRAVPELSTDSGEACDSATRTSAFYKTGQQGQGNSLTVNGILPTSSCYSFLPPGKPVYDAQCARGSAQNNDHPFVANQALPYHRQAVQNWTSSHCAAHVMGSLARTDFSEDAFGQKMGSYNYNPGSFHGHNVDASSFYNPGPSHMASYTPDVPHTAPSGTNASCSPHAGAYYNVYTQRAPVTTQFYTSLSHGTTVQALYPFLLNEQQHHSSNTTRTGYVQANPHLNGNPSPASNPSPTSPVDSGRFTNSASSWSAHDYNTDTSNGHVSWDVNTGPPAQ